MLATRYTAMFKAGFNWAEIIKEHDINVWDIEAIRPSIKFNGLSECDQYYFQGELVVVESPWYPYQDGELKFFITNNTNEFVVFRPLSDQEQCYVIFANYHKVI